MSRPTRSNRQPSSTNRMAISICVLVIAGLVGAALFGTGVAAIDSATDQQISPLSSNETVSEPAYEAPVPEPGDEYYETAAADGSWVSYVNPRDEYRDPYLGDGSGKICVAVLNEHGDTIVGESLPNTSVEIPTGEALDWHTHADPITVEFPLTTQYERPLDADQFGTAEGLAQGDGWLDSHCIEWHGLRSDTTITYGEATIHGEHAASIELIGYVQQTHGAWESDVDPIADAEPYDRVGGWTYEPDASHGQVVIVLQLNASTGVNDGGSETNNADTAREEPTTHGDRNENEHEHAADTTPTESDGINEHLDALSGFVTLATLIGLVIIISYSRLR